MFDSPVQNVNSCHFSPSLRLCSGVYHLQTDLSANTFTFLSGFPTDCPSINRHLSIPILIIMNLMHKNQTLPQFPKPTCSSFSHFSSLFARSCDLCLSLSVSVSASILFSLSLVLSSVPPW